MHFFSPAMNRNGQLQQTAVMDKFTSTAYHLLLKSTCSIEGETHMLKNASFETELGKPQ